MVGVCAVGRARQSAAGSCLVERALRRERAEDVAPTNPYESQARKVSDGNRSSDFSWGGRRRMPLSKRRMRVPTRGERLSERRDRLPKRGERLPMRRMMRPHVPSAVHHAWDTPDGIQSSDNGIQFMAADAWGSRIRTSDRASDVSSDAFRVPGALPEASDGAPHASGGSVEASGVMN